MFVNATASEVKSERAFSLELLIIAGDTALLRAEDTPAHHKRGLLKRIVSALGSLRLLAREQQALADKSDPELLDVVGGLRNQFNTGELDEFQAELGDIIARYPLALDGLRSVDASPADLEAGERIYVTQCAPCHAHPNPRSDTPAYDLFAQATKQSEAEFTARLLGGVRGTGAIGLRNPLADNEIAGLKAFFLSGARAQSRN